MSVALGFLLGEKCVQIKEGHKETNKGMLD